MQRRFPIPRIEAPLLRGLALGLSLSLVLVACSPAPSRPREGAGVAPPSQRAGAVGPPIRVDYATAKAQLDERLAALRARYQAFPWPAQTPEEIGRILNYDPWASWAFVRRALRYEPYRGVLRGAQGALSAGGGNSADLSLLLRAMLAGSPAPPPMRFAMAELPSDQAAALVDRAVKAAPARPVFAVRRGAALPTDPASVLGSEVSRVHGADTKRLLKEARSALRQVEALAPGNTGADLDRDLAVAAAREHVWLQVYHRGRWESFDPAGSLPVPSSARLFDELPTDWHHTVTVTVEVERLATGRLDRQSLFAGTWRVADLGQRAIRVLVLPTALAVDRLLDPGARGSRLADQAKGFTNFQVAVGPAGEKLAPGLRFDLEGTTSTASPYAVDPFGRARRAVGQPSPGSGPAASAGSTLAGLWLTVTLDSPGAEPARVERALLDRIGAARRMRGQAELAPAWVDPARVGLALIQQHEILLPSGPMDLLGRARRAIERLIDQPTLQQAVALQYGVHRGSLGDAIKDLGLPAAPATLAAVNNNALVLAAADAAGRGIVYLDRPNVYIRGEALAPREDGTVAWLSMIDIAVNRLQVLGDPGVAGAVRRLHGVLVSTTEGRWMVPGPGVRAVTTAAMVLQAAADQRIPLRVVRAPSDLARLNVDADSMATMVADLEQGHVLLAPEKPVSLAGRGRVAWWRMDREGHLLAVGADGRGQASTEGVLILENVSVPQVKRTMQYVACLNQAVAGGADVVAAGAECMAQTVRDGVREELDNLINEFIVDPLKDSMESGAEEVLGEDMMEYWKLYKQAKEELEQLQQKVERAADAVRDPAGQIPGIKEGRDVAEKAQKIAGTLAARVYLMLVMGREIAAYASRVRKP